MIDPTLPGYWDNFAVSFIAANGTKAKILVDVQAPMVVPAITTPTLETGLPGEASVRQRVLTGGCRVLDGLITSSDTAAKSLLVYTGKQTTLAAAMGTITTTATSNATITRSAGSFITDGWQVGDMGMVFGSVSGSAANDGSVFRVTAVAAGVLTLDGIGGISVAGTEGAGYRLFRLGQSTRKPVPANSGNSDSATSVPLVSGANDPRLDSSGIMLGQNGVLVVALAAALTALPCQLSVTAHIALY